MCWLIGVAVWCVLSVPTGLLIGWYIRRGGIR